MHPALQTNLPQWRDWSGGGHQNFPAEAAVSTHNWNQLVFTYDKATQAMKGYLNATLHVDLIKNINYGTLDRIWIGRWYYWYLKGPSLAQIIVYDRALSEVEVQSKFETTQTYSAPNCEF